MVADSRAPTMSRDINPVLKIFRILDPDQRRGALRLLGMMMIGMVLEMLGVGLVVPAIALMTRRDFTEQNPYLHSMVERLGNPSQEELVLGAIGALVIVYLVKTLFLGALAWRQSRFAFQAQARMSKKLFSRYLTQPYIFHVQHNSAQLLQNLTTEIGFFASHALLPGMLLAVEVFVLCGIGALLVWVEPLGALVVCVVVGMASWLFYRLTKTRLARWGRARQLHEGMRLQQIQQGLGGVKDVKMLGREADFLARFESHNTANAKVLERLSTLQQIPRLWLELLAVAGLALLVLSMVAQHRSLETFAPTLGLFAAAAFRLMPSMNRVLTSLQALRYGRPVVDLLYREFAESDVGESPRGDTLFPQFCTEIRFSGTSYCYPGCLEPALDKLSLRIGAGEMIGLIGSSGSGKSTLVDIMLGLLAPSSGAVEVDGRNIADNLRHWQRQIGYVPQSIYLTDDSLRRNVAFGVPDEDIDEGAVLRAISLAQLDEFVSSLPTGLDSFVGERGVRLSGGQRQRIGIARALYNDPPVLVLDEATSALDTETEAAVIDAVNTLRRTRTIVIIAHRLSTVQQCDRVYRLERGHLVAEGAPAEILGEVLEKEN